MKEIAELALEAQKALELLKNGTTYPSFYVVERFEKAAQECSTDALIGHMRDIIVKRAHTQDMITQKEIAALYDGLSGTGSTQNFRGTLGDLLPENHAMPKAAQKGSHGRVHSEEKLEPIYQDSTLSDALSTVFSLNKEASFYQEGMDRKAEEYAALQLKSLDCPPNTVKALQGNEHYILCLATYNTSDFSQVNVKIPVKVSGGVAELPTQMIQNDKLIELNKLNLLVHIKDEQQQRNKEIRNKFALSHRQDMVEADAPVVPKSLEPYADLENDLIVAASKHNAEQVKMASLLVSTELSKLGVDCSQVRVHLADDKMVTFRAEIPTAVGYAPIYVPVEMHNGRPILPSKFAAEANADSVSIYDLDTKGLRSFVSQAQPKNTNGLVSRHAPAMNEMSYHELMDKVIEGAHTKDYRTAEDALATINNRFGQAQYLGALDKYSKMLKHSSASNERNLRIKEAMERGDLIMVPTSVEPYCPKLGLPASKIDFDDRGRPIPLRRKAQAENSDESNSAYMSTSKIFLT